MLRVARFIRGMSALAAAVGAAAAGAVTVMPGDALPAAVSYEYFGLNFAENIQTSTSVGTLTYTGMPGCGGVCSATTSLGYDPSVATTNNEITFDNTAGGYVKAELGYYFAYLDTPGTYDIGVETGGSVSAPDGASVTASLLLGQARDTNSTFNNFATLDLVQALCANGCLADEFDLSHAAALGDTTVSLQANTLYFVELEVLTRAGATGVPESGMVDPRFTSAGGGTFVFSPGVTGVAVVPEPANWAMMIAGFGLIGGVARRWRRPVAA